MTSTPTVHQIAQAGFGEGTNALYDTYRPSYPSQQLEYILSSLRKPSPEPSTPWLNVLEIGSGTGIFTRSLLAHEDFGPAVAQLHAVEPSSGMRGRFEETVKDERVSCREGTFDGTGAEDGWADLVVVAQAWHWCPDYDKALAEFARVLKPNGIAAFIWNLEDGDVPWVAANRNIYERYELGTPQFHRNLWRKMFDVPAINLFKKPHKEHEVTWSLETSLPAVVERVFTKSYIAVQPESEKAKIREEIVEATTRGEGRKWIDEAKGTWEYPHKNLVVIIQRN